jgi:hypothetical protein
MVGILMDMNKIEFLDLFKEHEEYPEKLAERGVPNNTYLTYVSTTFLNGYVNYIDIISAYLVNRYDIDEDWTDDNIKHWTDKLGKDFHSDLSEIFDDVLILGETENCYWYLWSDCDVSDSCIGRFDKGNYTKDQVISLFEEYIRTGFTRHVKISLSGWKTL